MIYLCHIHPIDVHVMLQALGIHFQLDDLTKAIIRAGPHTDNHDHCTLYLNITIRSN